MQRRSEPALKLQVYLPASLKHEIERAAEARGQSLSTFVARTLSTAMQPTGNPQAGK
jgi:predicted HicB family RNase H-like nuclease